MSHERILASACALLVSACVATEEPMSVPTETGGPRRYQADMDLLRSHLDVVELVDEAGMARVAIVPAYQGRVMTSTTSGRQQTPATQSPKGELRGDTGRSPEESIFFKDLCSKAEACL